MLFSALRTANTRYLPRNAAVPPETYRRSVAHADTPRRMNEGFMQRTRLITLGGVWLLFLTLSGCAKMMHEMQPHRLWRLNYQSKSGNSDGSYGSYFSVDDTLEKALPTKQVDVIVKP